MKRHVLIVVLAISIILLHACANTNDQGKQDSTALITEFLQIPNTDNTPQETTSTDEQGAGYTIPQISESDASSEVSPLVSPEKPENTAQETIVAEVTPPSPADDINRDINPEPALPQNSVVEQPPLMTQAVQAAGLSFDDLAFSQFVLVAADGSEAMIYCYDRGDNGQWALNEGIGYITGYVGINGISVSKSEGDGNTPAGLFSLGYAFGNNQKPLTAMAYKTITKESYWVDDPASIYYNQWVEGNGVADWSSAEHLSESLSSYAYAVVVEYNMIPNTIAGAGSAIFIHCGNKPTSGCIAVSQESILKVLKWLSPDKNPSILITAQ